MSKLRDPMDFIPKELIDAELQLIIAEWERLEIIGKALRDGAKEFANKKPKKRTHYDKPTKKKVKK